MKLMELIPEKNKADIFEINYEGVAKVLAQFVKLYEVCENKELIDKCLEHFVFPIFKIEDK